LPGKATPCAQPRNHGGKFLPHVFGWMVHVYPYATDPKDIWSTSDDHASGHDNMAHSAMPGMKME